MKKISFFIDINEYSFLDKIIKDYKVDMIFHAAAYKHVNILENNIFSAVKNNILQHLMFVGYQLKIHGGWYSSPLIKQTQSQYLIYKKVAEKARNFNENINNKKKLKLLDSEMYSVVQVQQ